MPEVLNKYKLNGRTGIYVGRGTIYGNPFVIGKDGDRATVIRKFEEYFNERGELRRLALKELRGRNLICYCAPLACHADILLRYANNPIHNEA